jgi:hypothetical protein
MIGKIIGAIAGAKAAQHTRGVDTPGGALLGVATVALGRRFGLKGLLAAAAGGYALKRYNERSRARQPATAH